MLNFQCERCVKCIIWFSQQFWNHLSFYTWKLFNMHDSSKTSTNSTNHIYDCSIFLAWITWILDSSKQWEGKVKILPIYFGTWTKFIVYSLSSLQRANKSHRFYKGTVAVLNKPIKSEFILVQQNEKDLKIENGTEKVLDELKEANSSSITLRDFCNSNLLNQFIFEVAIFF